MDTVSILIPRKVRVVMGPLTLAGSTASPSLMAVRIARSKYAGKWCGRRTRR